MSGLDIITLGCRLNSFESEVMRDQAASAGLQNAVIINSCAVTGEAVRQTRQTIRKLRRERPEAQIIVTGCAAQLDPQGFAAMPEVDRVLGNEEKLQAASFAPDRAERILVKDISQVRELAGHLVEGFGGRARAFVQIQQGCDHRCTFCIIPYARGPNRSVPLGVIVEQIRKLVAADYSEVVLTGVDISSYGADLPGGDGSGKLGAMLRRLLKAVPELPRLRLSSLDMMTLDEDLIALLGHEERLMPHLHLSLQAGDDMILKRMKRRHSRGDAVAFCAAARRARPDIVFGADLIAGFPTEDDAMFENSLSLIADCGLSYLHVFPYSPRPGTPAARMPQLPGDVRKARAARLRAAGARARSDFYASHIGQTARVLVERPGFGHSEHFLPVHLSAEQSATSMPGQLVDVVPLGFVADDRQNGELAA